MLLKLDVCKCALLKEAACDRFHEWSHMSVCRQMLTSALTMLAKQGSADSKDDWRSFHFLRTLGRRNFQAQLKLDALFSSIEGPIFDTAFWRLFWGPCFNNSLAGSHFWFPIWDPKLVPGNCKKTTKLRTASRLGCSFFQLQLAVQNGEQTDLCMEASGW